MRVGAACIDHGFRSESASEVELVRGLCAALGVPFFTQKLALTDGPDLEARARHARYAALEALRVEHGFRLVATAHSADDQAETVLMRLGRGASLRGLAAIRERNANVLRPLLFARRADLRAYVKEQRLPFVDDPMNEDPRFLRVRVRRELLPTFEALFPAGVEAAARLACHAAEDEEVLSALADAAFDRLVLEDGAVDTEGLKALPLAIRRRVLRALLEEAELPVTGELIDGAVRAVDEGLQITLPEDAVLRTASGAARVVPSADKKPPFEIALRPGVWVLHPPSGVEVGLDVTGGTWESDAVSVELTLSAVRPGDRLASGGGKLQDVLVDLRIPREERSALPIIRGADGRVVCAPLVLRSTEAGPHRVAARLAAGRTAPRWAARYKVGE